MEAKRAIDSSLSVSKEQNTEREGLKMRGFLLIFKYTGQHGH